MLTVSLLSSPAPTALLSINGDSFEIEKATTTQAQERGLSGRESMPQDQAMVFVFDKPAVRCFWMKDMKFSIDMVWLNESKQVSAIEYNVSPDSYPDSYCHVDAQYVVEFAEGTATRLHLQPGDVFKF